MAYGVIIADPPWQYRDRMTGMKKTGLGAATKYTTMVNESIEQFLTTEGIRVADDAHLWLWTTNAFIEPAHAVVRAWGFAPKTIVTWVKGRLAVDKSTGVARLVAHIAQGHYLRNSTEHVIFAVRGQAPVAVHNLPTHFVYPGRWKNRQHSEKPPIIHEWAERLRPNVTRVELFARRRRPGWTCLGNEVAA